MKAGGRSGPRPLSVVRDGGRIRTCRAGHGQDRETEEWVTRTRTAAGPQQGQGEGHSTAGGLPSRRPGSDEEKEGRGAAKRDPESGHGMGACPPSQSI